MIHENTTQVTDPLKGVVVRLFSRKVIVAIAAAVCLSLAGSTAGLVATAKPAGAYTWEGQFIPDGVANPQRYVQDLAVNKYMCNGGGQIVGSPPGFNNCVHWGMATGAYEKAASNYHIVKFIQSMGYSYDTYVFVLQIATALGDWARVTIINVGWWTAKYVICRGLGALFGPGVGIGCTIALNHAYIQY